MLELLTSEKSDPTFKLLEITPHIAYNFNYHAKSTADYRELLFNLPELKFENISTREIYEFFYVHHYLMWPDNYIFPSYEDYVKNSKSNLQSDTSL
jgi:hypothetical protein